MFKMEEQEYNWGLILKASIPISIIVGYTFYTNASNFLKWLVMLVGIAAAGGIVYSKDKKKGDIFTAAAIVMLTAVVVMAMKKIGIL